MRARVPFLAWLVALTAGVAFFWQFDALQAETRAPSASLRFYGHGADGLDRVRIRIDAPERPADIGATDFTIEFWIRATAGENNGSVSCGDRDGWITGNIVVDRDIYFEGDYGDFGVALGGGRPAFGLSVGTSGTTLCATTRIDDGRWHHVAVTRRTTGALRIFVDGALEGEVSGPPGDASYRNGRPSSFPNDPYLVLGAEKHDAGAEYPSFNGWLDELRLSTTVRYDADFVPSRRPFAPDGSTAALYHFDSAPGPCTATVTDSATASGGQSTGECRHGGDPSGPVYVSDTPFAASTATPRPSATPTRRATATSTRTPTPVAVGTRTFLPTVSR